MNYATPSEVREYVRVRPSDLDVASEGALDSLLEQWIGQVTDLVNADRNRNYATEGRTPAYFEDGFSTDDDVLDGRVAPTGQTWETVRGQWTVADGYAKATTTQGWTASIVPGQANGILRARIILPETPDTAEAGIVFRYIDNDNYWRVTYHRTPGAHRLFLVNVTDGDETTYAQPAYVPTGSPLTIEVLAQNERIQTGVLRGKDEDAPSQGAELFGIYASAVLTQVDYLSAFKLPEVPEGIRNVVIRGTSKLVEAAIANRTLSVMDADGFDANQLRSVIFTEDITADLRRYPAKARLRMLGLAGTPEQEDE